MQDVRFMQVVWNLKCELTSLRLVDDSFVNENSMKKANESSPSPLFSTYIHILAKLLLKQIFCKVSNSLCHIKINAIII